MIVGCLAWNMKRKATATAHTHTHTFYRLLSCFLFFLSFSIGTTHEYHYVDIYWCLYHSFLFCGPSLFYFFISTRHAVFRIIEYMKRRNRQMPFRVNIRWANRASEDVCVCGNEPLCSAIQSVQHIHVYVQRTRRHYIFYESSHRFERCAHLYSSTDTAEWIEWKYPSLLRSASANDILSAY